jgi:hypothetical protein
MCSRLQKLVNKPEGRTLREGWSPCHARLPAYHRPWQAHRSKQERVVFDASCKKEPAVSDQQGSRIAGGSNRILAGTRCEGIHGLESDIFFS